MGSMGAACPSGADLEEFVASGTAAESLREHIRRCGRCSRQVRRIRADNELIADYVSANADRLGPENVQSSLPQIAGYDLLGEIHRGAQGVIYDAVQSATKRRVAVKTLVQGAFATSRQRRRFEREVELVAVLRHPHIVTIYDSGRTADGGHFLAMEYVEGVELDRFLRGSLRQGTRRERRAILRRRLELFAKVCDAVNAAHQRGIMHRDLKPDNILVDELGDPHVLDFGLAKQERSGDTSGVFPADDDTTSGTIIGEFLGTFAYASPEQAGADPAEIDVRSDVYALGIILFEMVTGKRPYALTGAMTDVIATIRTTTPMRASAINDTIDADLEAIIDRAMAKSRENRYQSAGELREDLRRYIDDEPVAARGYSQRYMLGKMIGRHKLAAAALAGAVLVLVTTTAVVTGLLVGRDAQRTHELYADTMIELVAAREACRLESTTAADLAACTQRRWDAIIDERLAKHPELAERARAAMR